MLRCDLTLTDGLSNTSQRANGIFVRTGAQTESLVIINRILLDFIEVRRA